MRVKSVSKNTDRLLIEMTQEEYQRICYLIEREDEGKIFLEPCKGLTVEK